MEFIQKRFSIKPYGLTWLKPLFILVILTPIIYNLLTGIPQFHFNNNIEKNIASSVFIFFWFISFGYFLKFFFTKFTLRNNIFTISTFLKDTEIPTDSLRVVKFRFLLFQEQIGIADKNNLVYFIFITGIESLSNSDKLYDTGLFSNLVEQDELTYSKELKLELSIGILVFIIAMINLLYGIFTSQLK